MDDDSRTITMQIKGKAYRFAPLDPEDLGKIQILSYMDVSDGIQVKALFRLLKKSMGAEAWDELSTRFVAGEVDLLGGELDRILKKLMAATVKGAKASADAS